MNNLLFALFVLVVIIALLFLTNDGDNNDSN